MTDIRKIEYQNKNKAGSHFDLVYYSDILKSKPTDHDQFEHHKLSFYVLSLFVRNSGKYNVNFQDYTVNKGTVFTLREGAVHRFYENDLEAYFLVFTEEFLTKDLSKSESSKVLLLFNELLASPKMQLSTTAYEEALNLTKVIEKEYFLVNDEHSSFVIRNCLLALFTMLLRTKLRENNFFNENKYLNRFLEFQMLVERYCFENRKVQFYAKKMGVSSKTLNTVTQNILHRPAKQFINDTLISLIKRRIISSPKSLTDISYEVGFDEPTNFFKYFAKYAGITAQRFRET